MHDELMSSMDISQKMLELTACAILPITDNKLNDMNISNNRLICIDNKINNENNDSNDSNSNSMNERSSDESVDHVSDESIKQLVNEYVDEVIDEKEKHFCDRINAKIAEKDEKIIENGCFAEKECVRSDDGVEDEPQSIAHLELDPNESVIVLQNGLTVINGCVEPAFDPPENKTLRFTNQLQFLRVMMNKYLCRYKTALPFLKPVDCFKLKIPHYYNVITHPMDLTTIKRRLMFLWYSSAHHCIDDFNLIFSNCYQFNCSDDSVYKAGKKLEEYLNEKLKDMPTDEIEIACPSKPSILDFEKKVVKRNTDPVIEQSRALLIGDSIFGESVRQRGGKKMITRSEHGLQVRKPNKDLPTPLASPPQPPPKRVQLNASMKFCLELVKEMFIKKHREYAWPFYEPVSVQMYPDYYNFVKKPMDLTTIKINIESGQYRSVKQYVKDMRLMFTNCLRYNKPEAPVVEQARKLREFFEFRFAKIPEEYLKEKMTTNVNNYNQNHTNSDHHNSHKTEVVTTNGDENQERMEILENQVKLLLNSMSALTGVTAKQSRVKNGVKKQRIVGQTQSSSLKRKRNTVNNKTQKQNKPKKESPLKKRNKFIDEDVDDDMSNSSLVSSPISFQYNDMEDLKQLKTDLENLDAKDLKSVLRILQTTEPSIRCDNEENIEIDFEILKPETLIALRKFVSSCMLNNIPKKIKSSVNGLESSKKSSNCDMTNDFSFRSDSSLYPSTSRLSESSSDSESESSSDSESSDNDED